MDNYQKLHKLIFDYNKKRYSLFPFCWEKIKTIKYLLEKIPDLKTSFLTEVKSFSEVDSNLTRLVFKDTHGHSGNSVYVLDKIKDGIYKDNIRNIIVDVNYLNRVSSKFKQPFIEKCIGFTSLPYDIKVHIFFGRICFFYIYGKKSKNGYEKSRYDNKCNYINYNLMFYPNIFKEHLHFKERRTLIDDVNKTVLKEILEYSLKIFNNLNGLYYCSIDWLYDPVSNEYAFGELTPTPYVLSKPVKNKFIKDYINKCHPCLHDHSGLCSSNNICMSYN
jgi:hypothetical protein